jgi:type I restriction enzyme R subunit
MPLDYRERAFEDAIEHHLTTAGGYVKGDRDGFDPHRAVFPADVLAFIKATQPDEWAYLEGIQKAKAEETLLDDLCRALDSEHRAALISATVTGKIDVRAEVG